MIKYEKKGYTSSFMNKTEARVALGALLKKYREIGMFGSINVVARMIGVHNRVVSRMEKGIINPTKNQTKRAIKALIPLRSEDRKKAFQMWKIIYPPFRQKNTKRWKPATKKRPICKKAIHR